MSRQGVKTTSLKQNVRSLLLLCLIIQQSFFHIRCEPSATKTIHYNIHDPDCTGPFGLCTKQDKEKLGYIAIEKLHALMDNDRDGNIEFEETNEFLKGELQYGNNSVTSIQNSAEKQQNFHDIDSSISVDEMWKTWRSSVVYNWTTENIIQWLIDQVKLPQYTENFRRNKIDGQLLPRLMLNENNYYSTIMQIKDPHHKHLLMMKITDLVLFGYQKKTNNLSIDHIKSLMIEFDKLSMTLNLSENGSSETLSAITELQQNLFDPIKRKRNSLDSSKYGLNMVKQEAEELKRAREGAEGQLMKLKLAEQEIENLRVALKQTETRLETVKFQTPNNLTLLLNKTFQAEKALLDFKFKLIDKDKATCIHSLKKVSKRQSGIFGALKIAHSSALEEINAKLEALKREIEQCKAEKQEWNKRWSSIYEICYSSNNSNNSDSISQDSY